MDSCFSFVGYTFKEKKTIFATTTARQLKKKITYLVVEELVVAVVEVALVVEVVGIEIVEPWFVEFVAIDLAVQHFLVVGV